MDQHHLGSARAGISTRTRCALSNPKSEVLPRINTMAANTQKLPSFVVVPGDTQPFIQKRRLCSVRSRRLWPHPRTHNHDINLLLERKPMHSRISFSLFEGFGCSPAKCGNKQLHVDPLLSLIGNILNTPKYHTHNSSRQRSFPHTRRQPPHPHCLLCHQRIQKATE